MSAAKKCAGGCKIDPIYPIYRVTWPGTDVETHTGEVVGQTPLVVRKYCFACAIREYDRKTFEVARIVREIG